MRLPIPASRPTPLAATLAPAATLAATLALAACAPPGAAPLVSAQFPPNVGANSEPQPAASLPPGAGNTGPGPNATHPNYLTFSFPFRR